jgi:hypothetical protein
MLVTHSLLLALTIVVVLAVRTVLATAGFYSTQWMTAGLNTLANHGYLPRRQVSVFTPTNRQ